MPRKPMEGQPSPETDDPIHVLELSSRTENALLRNDICTVGGLLAMPARRLRNLPGLGPVSVREICEALEAHGRALGQCLETGRGSAGPRAGRARSATRTQVAAGLAANPSFTQQLDRLVVDGAVDGRYVRLITETADRIADALGD